MKPNRFVFLDIFRGLTVCLMILVNNPGSWGHIYSPLKHAAWHGLTLADLVFPFFLFAVGVSIPISIKESPNWKKIFLRSGFIFSLGIFLNGFPNFHCSTIRIPGVLQRIAIVYFFCALFLIASKRFLDWQKPFLLFLFLFFNLLHSYTLLFVPSPNEASASLEIGKNISAYIDNFFLKGHLWQYSKTWDPEGILSTVTSVSSGIVGVYFGMELKNNGKLEIVNSLLIAFIIFLFAFGFQPYLPFNKSLWTSSFVLMTSSLAIGILIIIYFLSELKKIQSLFSIFRIFGESALFIYFVSSLLAKLMNIPFLNFKSKSIGIKTFLYAEFFKPYFTAFEASFLWSIFIFILCYIILILKRSIRHKKKHSI